MPAHLSVRFTGGPRPQRHDRRLLLRLLQAQRWRALPPFLIFSPLDSILSTHPFSPSPLKSTGSIEGFYHDVNSSPYQRLDLRCVSAAHSSLASKALPAPHICRSEACSSKHRATPHS